MTTNPGVFWNGFAWTSQRKSTPIWNLAGCPHSLFPFTILLGSMSSLCISPFLVALHFLDSGMERIVAGNFVGFAPCREGTYWRVLLRWAVTASRPAMASLPTMDTTTMRYLPLNLPLAMACTLSKYISGGNSLFITSSSAVTEKS